MNSNRSCILLLVGMGVFALRPSSAVTPADANNPYQDIATRNVFGLVPIPVAPPPGAEAEENGLPKITPNGIQTIFGKLQVLFKVADPKAKPGEKEDCYVMTEGERQDGIEVQKIDEKGAVITFDNHGRIQTLALVEGKASGGTPPPTESGRPGVPRLPNVPTANAGQGAAATPFVFGHRMGRGRAANPESNAGSAESGAALAGSVNAQADGQEKEQISPEAQVIMMEAQRAKWMDEGNGAASIIPPTPITSEVIGGEGDNGASGPPAPGQ